MMEITKEELKLLIETSIKNAITSCKCPFEAEEVTVLKDVATGGKAFKRIIIYLVVGALLVGIGIRAIPDVVKVLK